MKPPLVSVLLPVRNGAAYIEKALHSLLKQTYPSLEILVLDDASRDDSVRRVETIGDSRVRVIHFDESQGLSRLLNRGWAAATGTYIARMDADDVSEPQRIEKQLAYLNKHSEIAGCGTWVRMFGAGRPFLARYPIGPAVLHAYALFDNPLAHPTVCLRRDVFEREGLRYNEEVGAAQDYELWIRALDRVRMDNVPEVLLRYRQHQQAVSDQKAGDSESRTLQLQRVLLERLGVKVDEDAGRFHRLVGHGAGMVSDEEMQRAEGWLQYLVESNRTAKLYDEDGMRRAIGFVWLRIALNSARVGRWAVRRYRESPFAGWYKAAARERAQLESTSLLAPLRRSHSGRSGIRGRAS